MNDTEKCVALIGNRFNLVLIGAIRARELKRGSRPLVDNDNNSSAIVTALKEIENGKVGIEYLRRVR
jgi:DNA-directed RNA polymerase subunit omega